MYKRKTEDEFQVHQRTSVGWEEVHAESTRRAGMARLREYRANQPEYPAKLVKRRVPLEAQQ